MGAFFATGAGEGRREGHLFADLDGRFVSLPQSSDDGLDRWSISDRVEIIIRRALRGFWSIREMRGTMIPAVFDEPFLRLCGALRIAFHAASAR